MNILFTASGPLVRNSSVTSPARESQGRFAVDSEPEKTESPKPEKLQSGTSNEQASLVDLTDSEKQMVNELKARDKEVRAHEQKHKAMAGKLAKGAIEYTYQRGPDGKSYAVGGEIKIDMSPIPNDPQATVQKAQQIIKTALAVSEPSPADRQVAAQAAQMLAEAQRQMYMENTATEQMVANSYSQNSSRAQEEQSKDEKTEEVEQNDFEFTEIVGANYGTDGGADILGLISAEQNQSKTDLPGYFADSVLMTRPVRVNINQFVNIEGMVSTQGVMNVGGRVDVVA
ncbi:MAG: hypothetical protein D6B27_12970 [Gammaproteobacteria bacterium]|nr:MAG: hypothetical protein D6B27_12970 [Gammaproteobacteria bacterium]